QLAPAVLAGTGEQARRLVHNGLKKAVEKQLISDAPIGVFLSGGIDSSLLALLANNETEQLKTVSICFNESNYDERIYQNAVTDKLQGERYVHLVKQSDFEDNFYRIISDMDMPTTDGINTWFISNYARRDGLKAVLSGLGADELFGGYPSFKRIGYLRYLSKIPGFMLSASKSVTNGRFRKISFLAYQHPRAAYLFMRGLFIPADIAQLVGADVNEVERILFSDAAAQEFQPYDKTGAAWFERHLYMQNQLLRDTDVMSMAHGLEVRVPFLDEEFQHQIENIRPEIRLPSGLPKKLLIESFDDLLPDIVWKRPKMGFSFPLQDWMRRHPEISEKYFYRGNLSKKIIGQFKKGQIHWSKAFALYQTQLNG
ncbi:MAG: asparagine synthase C-terminal domain-containing protein, partial [Bacteroidota bacterium]